MRETDQISKKKFLLAQNTIASILSDVQLVCALSVMGAYTTSASALVNTTLRTIRHADGVTVDVDISLLILWVLL